MQQTKFMKTNSQEKFEDCAVFTDEVCLYQAGVPSNNVLDLVVLSSKQLGPWIC
jgi:hypothetical protein